MHCKYPLEVETYAWNSLGVFIDYQLENNLNCLIETTGISWQIDDIWERFQGEDFYTVKFHAPRGICKHRSLARNKPKLPYPYDGDELEAIELTQELIDKVPFDWEVRTEGQWPAYETAEDEILRRAGIKCQ